MKPQHRTADESIGSMAIAIGLALFVTVGMVVSAVLIVRGGRDSVEPVSQHPGIVTDATDSGVDADGGSTRVVYGASASDSSKRSSRWPTVRKHFADAHPTCCICGKPTEQIHHRKPFSLFPELELEPSNLIPFCERCHLVFGHCFNYQNYNADVDKHIEMMRSAKEKCDSERKARKTTQAN